MISKRDPFPHVQFFLPSSSFSLFPTPSSSDNDGDGSEKPRPFFAPRRLPLLLLLRIIDRFQGRREGDREREDGDKRRGRGAGGPAAAVSSSSAAADGRFLGEASLVGCHLPAQPRDPVPPGPRLHSSTRLGLLLKHHRLTSLVYILSVLMGNHESEEFPFDNRRE